MTVPKPEGEREYALLYRTDIRLTGLFDAFGHQCVAAAVPKPVHPSVAGIPQSDYRLLASGEMAIDEWRIRRMHTTR
ncbi:hypothetical protein ABTY00_06175 [Streptomyces microflavus]|uniref:hypothetical protein n=1 Tax=Streptomyces microflavus TaxID=1919 RepID=UPI003332AD94